MTLKDNDLKNSASARKRYAKRSSYNVAVPNCQSQSNEGRPKRVLEELSCSTKLSGNHHHLDLSVDLVSYMLFKVNEN